MKERLRNDKKRLAFEVTTMLFAFIALQWVMGRVFGQVDGSSLSAGVKSTMLVVVVIGLAVFAVVGLQLLFTVRRTVETMKISVGAPDGWPPASFATRDRFSSLGFEQFGSIDVTFPDHTATFAGVLSPDGTTMGIVSPAHITMVSDFGGKILNTTSHPAGAPLRYQLRQSKRHGSPEELWELHRQGLAAVAEHGMSPTIYNVRSAMTDFVAIEEYSKTQFIMTDQAKGLVGRGTRALARDPRGGSRIVAWRDSPYRWQSKVS